MYVDVTMNDQWAVIIVVISSIIGLLVGRGLWALYISHRHNLPTIVERHRILDDAKRVQLDVDELTRRSQ